MTNREERLLELLQEHVLDKGIVLEGQLEQAFVEFGRACLKGYRVEGKKEDINNFKRGLPRFASHHNVTIIEN